MLLIALVVLYPELVYEASWWYLRHIHVIIAVLFVIDAVFWFKMYRRYRHTHPYVPVKLTKE